MRAMWKRIHKKTGIEIPAGKGENDKILYAEDRYLSNEELAVLYQRGDRQALELLTEQNGGLIRHIAFKFHVTSSPVLDYEDLTQTGWIGLRRAALSYEPGQAKFSTWACFWIKSYIGRLISNTCNHRPTCSLDEPIGTDADDPDKRTRKDLLEDPAATLPFEAILNECETESINAALQSALNQLSLFQRQCIDMYYGLSCGSPSTLQELSRAFGCPVNNVRAALHQGLHKIRHSAWARMQYKQYLQEGLFRKLYHDPAGFVIAKSELS